MLKFPFQWRDRINRLNKWTHPRPPNDVWDKLVQQVDTPPPNDVQDKLTEQVDTPPPDEPMDSVSEGFITVSKVKKKNKKKNVNP